MLYIYITSKHKFDLLHKNFIHDKFVSYGKREACHTRQVNVASGVISVKLEMGDVMLLLCCAWFVLQVWKIIDYIANVSYDVNKRFKFVPFVKRA